MKYIGQKGFSLVEIFVIIAIAMIVAAIAIPSLQSYAVNRSLKSAARDVESDFLELRERAISENTQYRMTFNIGGNNYTLEQPPGTVIQTKSPLTFGTDIRLNGAGTTATQYDFQTRGTVTNGNVQLINGRGSTATIVTNITGRTSVQFVMQ